GAVQKDGFGPRAFDARRGHEEVAHILEAADPPAHVRIDEVKKSIRIAERGSPNAAGVRTAAQIELRVARERTAYDAPILEISRMRNLHAGKPFESRGGDVVVVL